MAINTYKAILKGNRLEWVGEAPDAGKDRNLDVQVTVLDRPLNKLTIGQKMAEILDKLAQANAVSQINDPLSWQKGIRKDRPLPTR